MILFAQHPIINNDVQPLLRPGERYVLPDLAFSQRYKTSRHFPPFVELLIPYPVRFLGEFAIGYDWALALNGVLRLADRETGDLLSGAITRHPRKFLLFGGLSRTDHIL